MRVKNIVLGKPMANNRLSEEKLTRTWGLPIMASDAISSVAYSIEEILIVFVPVLGILSYQALPKIVIPIIVLLLILIFSYSQIISHYPHGGGSYAVANENIGSNAALLAATALIIDYILTVAVSISSSTAALASAFPIIAGHEVIVSLSLIAFITIMNLRGVKEASKIFGLPTYIFIASMLVMITTGIIKLLSGNLEPITYGEVETLNNSMNSLLLLVFLRAFASGCTAMSGIEAVSNSIPAFTEPATKHARHILYMLGLIIILVFGGTSILAYNLHVMPIEGETVLSQIAGAIFGNNFMYYFIQIMTSLILIFAANTAYNGLPQLLYILAKDAYVPRQFNARGTKLSLSNGIMFLFITSSLLIIIFKSDTHLLIPLYSVGVFISFTLAQLGMYIKWKVIREKYWQYKSLINLFGAIVTTIVLMIVIYSKFTSGAWSLVIITPIIMYLMAKTNQYYNSITNELKLDRFIPDYHHKNSETIVLIYNINKPALKAFNYAMSISDNVTALHISTEDQHAQKLKEKWEELNMPYPLTIINSDYRNIVEEMDQYLWEKEAKLEHNETISVILIKYITPSYAQELLHNQTTFLMRTSLTKHKDIITIEVPFHYELDKSYYRHSKDKKSNQKLKEES